MYEAFVTRACFERPGNPNDFNDFKKRKDAYAVARSEKPAVAQLEYLRNGLAHGVRPRNDQVVRTLDDENELRAALKTLRKHLFP
jgi:hypothetical protein